MSCSPVKPSGLFRESSLGVDPVFSSLVGRGHGAAGGPATSFWNCRLYQSSNSDRVGFEEPNGSSKDIPVCILAASPSAISFSRIVGIGTSSSLSKPSGSTGLFADSGDEGSRDR